MPDYALKNKHKDIGGAVLSLPEGATEDDLNARLADLESAGWSLDKRTDPASIPTPEDTQAAAATTEGK